MSNAPNESPEELAARYERQHAQEMRYAGRKVAYLCGALRFLGVEKVTAAFDAYGDEGSIKEAVFVPPVRDELPFGLVEEIGTMWTSFRTSGWGRDAPNTGLDGILTLDVVTGKVVEEFIAFRDEDLEGEME
jgi:hypothetical protein